MNKISIIFLLVVIQFFGFGQNNQSSYFTSNNGLFKNNINCITQDSKGYIWLGTSDGL